MSAEYEAARLIAAKAACHEYDVDWADIGDDEIQFMQKLFDAGHAHAVAEIVAILNAGEGRTQVERVLLRNIADEKGHAPR